MNMTTREFFSTRLDRDVKFGAIALFALLVSFTSSGRAETEDAVDRAYNLAAEGLSAYKSGNYAEALSSFERAFEITRLPALAVHMARANVKLGHWLSAMALYKQAIQLGDGIGDADVQARARAEAQAELTTLAPRIPRVRIDVAGAPPAAITVLVDGANVPTDAFATGWLVDPGEHTIVGLNGKETVHKRATVNEGETAEIRVAFVPVRVAEETQRNAGQQSLTGANASPNTLAWLSYGIGGTGLLVAGVAAVGAVSNRNHADQTGCNRTPRSSSCDEGSVNRYSTFRTIAGVGFYTGVAGVVAGTALYFTAPRQKISRDAKRHVLPWVGLESAGIEGSF
jgi:hypothetical protein